MASKTSAQASPFVLEIPYPTGDVAFTTFSQWVLTSPTAGAALGTVMVRGTPRGVFVYPETVSLESSATAMIQSEQVWISLSPDGAQLAFQSGKPPISSEVVSSSTSGASTESSTTRSTVPSNPPDATSLSGTGTGGAPITTSTKAPQPTPQDNTLSAGAIAGVAVGCLVAGGLIAGLLLWFCWRRKKEHHQPYPRESGYALASHEKGFTANTVPLAGPKQTSAVFGRGLPQPLEDKAISADVSKISSAIKNHVQSYYHDNRVSSGIMNHDGLHALGSGLPLSVGTLATLLSSSATREIALRFIIAWVVVSRMQPSTGSTKSFLPTELTQCYGKIMNGDRGFQTHTTLVAQWRVATSELMHSSYVRTPFSPSDDRHESIQAALATLDKILQPYADARMNDVERKRNLEELLKRSALFAFTLFSQPSEWEFEWQEEQGVTSGELCIFPALVQVSDETGQPVHPPRSFSEPIVRRLDT